MSPIAPAGSGKTKNGRADAVCVRATYIGPAPSDTISHAAPTDCMKVPMSDMTSAISRLRKSGVRRGRHRLGGPPEGIFRLSTATARIASLDVRGAIHRLLRQKRERLRRQTPNLGFDRERHVYSYYTFPCRWANTKPTAIAIKQTGGRMCRLGASARD